MLVTGFDAEWDRWTANVSVGTIQLLLSDTAEEGVDLSNEFQDSRGRDEDELWQEKYAIIGGLNIVYYFDENKRKLLGVAAGILGNGTGALAYYKQKLTDDLSVIGSIEYAEFFDDMMKGEVQPYTGSNPDAENMKQNQIFSPALSVGLSYTL